jgi:predicted ATP-grasp superfamily ATP-dependent carboligase
VPLLAPDPAVDEEGFVGALSELAEAADRPGILFPTHDAQLVAVARHAERIRPLALHGSGWDVIGPLMAKIPQVRLAEQAGVPVPRSFMPTTRAEAEAAAAAIPYPAIAKPSVGIAFKHAENVPVLRAETPDELVAAWERIDAVGDEAILQEVIPGGDDALWTVGSFSRDGGQAIGTFCGRKLVQRPPIFGTCRVGEARWADEPVAYANALLGASGFDGITQIEFKRDPRDGSFRLIEINLRTWQWHSLARRCGVDLVGLAYRDACGETVGRAVSGVRHDGRRWIAAVPHLKEAVSSREGLGDAVRPLLGLIEEPVLSLRDPRPGAVQVAGLAVGPVRRRLRRG